MSPMKAKDIIELERMFNEQTEVVWEFLRTLYPQIPENPPIVYLTYHMEDDSHAGMCVWGDDYIDLHVKYCFQYFDEMLTVILPHELAHMADWYIKPPFRFHGRNWKDILQDMGLDPDPYHYMVLKW